jgi:hypothetical protein
MTITWGLIMPGILQVFSAFPPNADSFTGQYVAHYF